MCLYYMLNLFCNVNKYQQVLFLGSVDNSFNLEEHLTFVNVSIFSCQIVFSFQILTFDFGADDFYKL